jgi:uncharacterized caspase-like protein
LLDERNNEAGMFWFIFVTSIYLTILVLVSIFRPKAGRRVALVIGNEAYESVEPLDKPVKDAALVAAALKRLGFKVDEQHNLRVTEMRDVLANFENKAKGAAWALVYYAGHGMEWAGKNWLIPICAEPAYAVDLKDKAVLAEHVLKCMSGASKLRIVILDACRTCSLRARIMMNEGYIQVHPRGLARMTPKPGEIVFFAARHGTESLEGADKDRPSIFTEALLEHIEVEGLELGRFFHKVTYSVLEAIKAIEPTEAFIQEPLVYGHIPDNDYYFKPPRRSR